MLLTLLAPLIFAASFTSSHEETTAPVQKLDISQLKSKTILRDELAKTRGFPGLDSLGSWMERVVSKNLKISEAVARGAMLFPADYFARRDFFHHVMDKYGYASLVKDMVDYNEDLVLFFEYLEKHRLNHFPQLPKSLREAVAQIERLDDRDESRYLLPLLSDYSIGNRKIRSFVKLESSVDSSLALFKTKLICHCLGTITLDPLPHNVMGLLSLPFTPMSYQDLGAIDQVAEEFPEQMNRFINGLSQDSYNWLALYRSGQPPSEEFWSQQVNVVNSSIFRQVKPENLLFDLIHHLLQHHRSWILEHLPKLSVELRTRYFLLHPEDTIDEAFPEETLSLPIVKFTNSSPRQSPFFEFLIAKYQFDNLKKAIKSGLNANRRDANRMLQIMQLSHHKYQHYLVGKSFNQIIMIIHFNLKSDFDDKEVAAWLAHILLRKDPTTWALFLLNKEP